MRELLAVGRFVGSIGAVILITALYSVLHVNPDDGRADVSRRDSADRHGWGIVEATTASVVAVLCFNFFFLPPVGTFTIADPQNWVAFVAFLATAIVASQLSGRARQREIDAVGRQRDLERLYALSRALLLSERGASMSGDDRAAHRRCVRAAGRRCLRSARRHRVVGRARRSCRTSRRSFATSPGAAHLLRRSGRVVIVIAIQLGGAPIGSLAVSRSAGLSDTVLQSIANLAAIGLERARSQEATARAEAAQQSSELRATVLDALAHEFKTPLTSMKAAASDLLASGSDERPRSRAGRRSSTRISIGFRRS